MTSIYRTVVRHTRIAPVRNSFAYPGYYWFVDVDALPRLPWPWRALAGFESRDHFADPHASLRTNVEKLLRDKGIDADGPIWMLAHARVFGFVFNPISVFWCHRADGDLAAVIAEVHNTYGQRHNYVLTPPPDGKYRTDKRFYVSPFYAVAGVYSMRLPKPTERLALNITLHRPDGVPFVATLAGTRRPATLPNLLRAAIRNPWTTLVGYARIKFQGIRLYARGLPIQPRPPHEETTT